MDTTIKNALSKKWNLLIANGDSGTVSGTLRRQLIKVQQKIQQGKPPPRSKSSPMVLRGNQK
jgi:hypothetical protein